MAILKLVRVGGRVWAWGMGIKELLLSLQVETGIPRAALCLLSGYFSIPLVPIMASKDGGGVGAPEGLSAKPRGARGLVLVRNWDPAPGGRHVGGLAVQVPSGLLILVLFVLAFLFSMP